MLLKPGWFISLVCIWFVAQLWEVIYAGTNLSSIAASPVAALMNVKLASISNPLVLIGDFLAIVNALFGLFIVPPYLRTGNPLMMVIGLLMQGVFGVLGVSIIWGIGSMAVSAVSSISSGLGNIFK
jgi:hypothetical protein